MIEKKKSSISLEKNRMAFFSAGLILVSSLSLAAFEWKTLTVKNKYAKNYLEEEAHVIEEEMLTELPEPKPQRLQPPAPQIPQIIETVVIDNNANNNNNVTITNNNIVDPNIDVIDFGNIGDPGPKTEDLDVIESWAQVMPSYPGGDKAMMEFISKNVDYPFLAKEMGEQGTAYVSFVVEKDGSISNVKILRQTLQYGLNEAAMDVVQKMPKWNPGEQRGKKVRVRFTIPIKFVLH
ncbi:MAG: energy transducer TonB [Crocinitomicaceae bacterium]|nr:energy transducer TonB [Crocinitomicaceae bacterium]